MTSYLSGSRIFFLEPVVHYCSSKDFVNKRCAAGETTVYQMESASELVLFTAHRMVDLHATQHETIFLCPNYELLSFFIENYVSTMNYCRLLCLLEVVPAPHRRSSSRAGVRQSCADIFPFSNS